MRETRSQRRRRQARDCLEAGLVRGQERADLYRTMQRELAWTPSRSTFYTWAQRWDQARAADPSGRWSLATDTTGRPDIILRLLAALLAVSKGERDEITTDDARWVVRLASAIPPEWPDESWRVRGKDGTESLAIEHGAVRLYNWAVRYADAERRDDANALAFYDDVIAMEYWWQDWHREAWPADGEGERGS